MGVNSSKNPPVDLSISLRICAHCLSFFSFTGPKTTGRADGSDCATVQLLQVRQRAEQNVSSLVHQTDDA